MTRQNSIHKQTGAALLVALIMLLISTMIGLASIRGTTLNEKMSSNMYDRSLSYQAAESALRAAEAALEADRSLGIDCTLNAEPCPPTPASTFNTTDPARWTSVAGSYLVNNALLESTPQYYIEKMGEIKGAAGLGLSNSANCDGYGNDCPSPLAAQFRITARSGAPTDDGRSVVALQITVNQSL